MIDLTDNPSRGDDGSKHPCPICGKLFYESEIEAHVNECLKDPPSKQAGNSRCSSCGKEFESSLLNIHEEQCDGRGSSEDDVFPIKRRRLVGTGPSRAQGSLPAKPSYQTTLADFHSPSSSESENIGKLPEGGRCGL